MGLKAPKIIMNLVFLHFQEIMTIEGCSEKTARKRIKQINESLKLINRTYVSIDAYCESYKISDKRVLAILEGTASSLK